MLLVLLTKGKVEWKRSEMFPFLYSWDFFWINEKEIWIFSFYQLYEKTAKLALPPF